jgi:very-short-patch-repair endonuclease
MQRYPSKDEKSMAFAKELRKNMTKEERHLWYDYLCKYKPGFRRQFVIRGYIVDFYCAEARLAIELDGSQHYEDDNFQRDMYRTEIIKEYGIKVIRYSNRDIHLRFRAVCDDIDKTVKKRLKFE